MDNSKTKQLPTMFPTLLLQVLEEGDNSAFDYDIGRYIGKNIKLNDFTKFQLLENPWFPPNTYNFPFSLHSKGGKDVKRFVGPHHLKAHHWLVLSDLHCGLYCKYCVLVWRIWISPE
ncbi:52 kDa repressor of the inhibitor of the protein kinase-like [Aphis craccivora]|uniref:52 kDa repressor of the inhibitor of the protein kinase-like n=1 Tax=Aphis craccivora TaxID=307492 RepID=A0A6G0VPZ7_APHCR|nr:52 kDa repressor of the inhibitor of the protein kinase-like [Aphis craccivora]